ncbi:hypothetical protein J6P04_01090 [bacterium]|nr:hypothetical protein [bacterium]
MFPGASLAFLFCLFAPFWSDPLLELFWFVPPPLFVLPASGVLGEGLFALEFFVVPVDLL